MRKVLRSLCAVVLLVLPLDGSISPLARVFAQAGDPVLVAAGDIAHCTDQKDEATARLLDEIPGTVVTLGDNAYPDGSLVVMQNCYGPSWGRHKARTRPSPGNHEYLTSGASGYFTYFGWAATPLDLGCKSNCGGYYSYNLGAWHIIALNSEIAHDAGSPQEQWLRADLARSGSACTLAYWHRPRFSSGKHGNTDDVAPLWQALYDYGADVVLNGHDHLYERFAPQNPAGKADSAHGIREFIVGTGGASLYRFSNVKQTSQARNNHTWGVLKLTLHPTSYEWDFVPIAGQSFTDSGADDCVAAAQPDLIHVGNFEVGTLAGWSSASVDGGDLAVTAGAAMVGTRGLQARIDDYRPIYVTDDRPLAEKRYRARFYFDPNSISMQEGDLHVIFNAIQGLKAGVLRLEFRRQAGRYMIRSALLTDTPMWVYSPWYGLGDGRHFVELDWRASAYPGADNGGLTLWIDGFKRLDWTGLDTDTRHIDRVQMGAIFGIDAGTRGTYYFDAFVARRRSYMGPAP